MPYHHLSSWDRAKIEAMWVMGFSKARMARELKRSPSTIGRELRRNQDRERGYVAPAAQWRYLKARERLVKAHKLEDSELMQAVKDKLWEGWSPEQIAGRFRQQDYADQTKMWISHETIYRFVYQDKQRGGILYKHLRRGQKKYGKRGTGRHPNRFIEGRVSIDERPAVVTTRARVGDWEGDTFFGRHRKSCLATLVERKSLYLVARKMPDCTARSLNHAVIEGLHELPRPSVQTITVDNGKEFARFKTIEQCLNARVYFADPYSAWQRGTGENTNGLLRQFVPRKTDLRNLTQPAMDFIVQRLNNRPRKKLKYRTPREVFQEALLHLTVESACESRGIWLTNVQLVI